MKERMMGVTPGKTNEAPARLGKQRPFLATGSARWDDAGDDPSPTGIHLSAPARRAFAILYSLNLAGDAASLTTLLEFAGHRPSFSDGAIEISPSACVDLARALRAAGYALDDLGVQRFKMERGFSGRLRVGSALGAAYARFARGFEARVNITDADWQALDADGRFALQLLLRMGRKPEDLLQVRRILQICDGSNPDAPGRGEDARSPILVGDVSARRLVGWAKRHGFGFTGEGLVALQRMVGAAPSTLPELAAVLIEALLCRDEPRHEYKRIEYQRYTLNRRTVTMLNKASTLLQPNVPLRVVVGSYGERHYRGAHPHMGGGVVDLELTSDAPEEVERAVAVLRRVGFAAWLRRRDGRRPHFHAVAIGDREMSPSAAWQVEQYFAGRDGRTRSGCDPHVALGIAPPAWTIRFRSPAAKRSARRGV